MQRKKVRRALLPQLALLPATTSSASDAHGTILMRIRIRTGTKITVPMSIRTFLDFSVLGLRRRRLRLRLRLRLAPGLAVGVWAPNRAVSHHHQHLLNALYAAKNGRDHTNPHECILCIEHEAYLEINPSKDIAIEKFNFSYI